MTALDPEHVVGVVGSGTMGGGIAEVAARAGHRVLVYDADPARAEQAVRDIGARLDRLVDNGRLDAAERDAVARRLEVVKQLEDLAPAGLVIEAAVESLDVKRDLFARLEQICPEAVLATNTSSISITSIGAALQRPERLVGMHFFNPAP